MIKDFLCNSDSDSVPFDSLVYEGDKGTCSFVSFDIEEEETDLLLEKIYLRIKTPKPTIKRITKKFTKLNSGVSSIVIELSFEDVSKL